MNLEYKTEDCRNTLKGYIPGKVKKNASDAFSGRLSRFLILKLRDCKE